MNKRIWRALGIAIPILTILAFWGLFQSIFGVGIQTNLFNTGITFGFLMGAVNLFILVGVWKKLLA